MDHSRRGFLKAGVIASTRFACVPGARADAVRGVDVHQQIIELADAQQAQRRARFAAVKTSGELTALQQSLRARFLELIGGLPEPAGAPPARVLGTIDAGDYLVEKLAIESFPGYVVTAALYRPKQTRSPCPAVLSPCGHSTVGKAEGIYQTLHINLVKKGYVVLTYDPVGQGERSQYWDAERGRSKFDLSCGEHAVLGNPLYLLGCSLARYRIWDGIRALDYLAARPEVDPKRIGCAGNSGGGNLTAYLSALDPRIAAAAICCYITTLPRRMRNRIQEDPSADPEQDIFGFVSEGIDHAGLLALIAPRPTLLGTARLDFFPIEGAIETFAEAKRLFAVAGVEERIERAEANERHGLSKPLRLAVYSWFDRWLAGQTTPQPTVEVAESPRPPRDLMVCDTGQVNITFRSRHLLTVALEEFDRRPKAARGTLRAILKPDPEMASPVLEEPGLAHASGNTLIVCVNGNEANDWRAETTLLSPLRDRGNLVYVLDPRGAGRSRSNLNAKRGDYADPISGVEENIAYNAFLVGKSLLGMRVTDVLAGVQGLRERHRPDRLMLCGRRDAAIVACLAAALDPLVTHLAVEELLPSFRALFSETGVPINAASILPGLLARFGDVPEILAQVEPRKVLISGGSEQAAFNRPFIKQTATRFSERPECLTEWLGA